MSRAAKKPQRSRSVNSARLTPDVLDEVKHENKGLWVVLDEDGYPIYCACWPEACHEHINEAINDFDIDGAAKWKVRRAELVPNSELDRHL